MTMNESQSKLYKVNEAAELLGVAAITVYRWLEHGHIHAVKLGPKLLRIPQSEIDRMLSMQDAAHP